ncbi:hypothetical protein BP6252_05600 [Coleophoma cylindrospora]|uniref:Uncharacterized protein n=1 Tax=Coleophoma cylindrospora TaxID=1849047 RepID=A0A3D8RTY3_9HELO|nr:hypothetical protein BP6252_05600 [Coleophoma cylindrospora]
MTAARITARKRDSSPSDGPAEMPDISEDAATTSAQITNVHNPKKQKVAHDVDEDMQGNAGLGEPNEPRVENVVPLVEDMEHEVTDDEADDYEALESKTDDDISFANAFADDIYQSDEFDLDDDEYAEKEYEIEEYERTFPNIIDKPLDIKISIYKDPEFEQWMQSICLDCSYQGKPIGHALGRHIHRGMIRRDFYRIMEEPCQDMSDVAFEVFDRYGSLKKEFKDHSVRKGSGAWSSELDEGILLLIETVSVDKSWRRNGIAAFMVEAVMKKANGRRPSKYSSAGMAFTLAIPACLNSVVDGESKGMSLKECRAVRGAHCDAATAFFRSIGFRRIGASSCFGVATDTNHATRKIPLAEDFDPQEAEQQFDYSDSQHDDGMVEQLLYDQERSPIKNKRGEKYPLHQKIEVLTDTECLENFKGLCELSSPEEAGPDWKTIDYIANNIIHAAATSLKDKTLAWLLDNIDQDRSLRTARNARGYTPLEQLVANLDDKRIRTQRGFLTVVLSDEFLGYPDEAIACIASLRGIGEITYEDKCRIKYGCTCESCIGGIISPRMKYVLKTQAEMTGDDLDFEVEDGLSWTMWHDVNIKHVAPDIQLNFRTNKSLRQGFANTFKFIASCLQEDQVPTSRNVLRIWENASEWPPVTRNFLQRGGTVISALKFVFESARDTDIKSGDGMFFDVPEFLQEVQDLPECRNDHEYGAAAIACGVEGVGSCSYVELQAV